MADFPAASRVDRGTGPEVQRALDTAYERATEFVKVRFARQLKTDDRTDINAAESSAVLTVAIAVVTNDTDVLLVCRREDDPDAITWQFPAGIVKPGAQGRTVAVRETLAETGIHCTVVRELGSRLHPITGVFCEYYLCVYLTGQVENRDTDENLSWQFPAGEVEPGESHEDAAVRETIEETDVTVRATKLLGERVHPATGRTMVYVACDLVSGTARVADEEELAEVAWCDRATLTAYVPYPFYGPVQDYLDTALR